MFELWVWGVCVVRHKREVVEQMSTAQILGGLGNDFAALHRLAIPKRRAVLYFMSQLQCLFIL